MNETRTVITRGRELGVPRENSLWESYEQLQHLARLYEHAVITIQPWQIPQGSTNMFPHLPPLQQKPDETDAELAARDARRKQLLIDQWAAFKTLCKKISVNQYVKQFYESPQQVPGEWLNFETPLHLLGPDQLRASNTPSKNLEDSWEQSQVYHSLLRMERTYF